MPVLWDKERSTIVNNKSSQIVRMHDCAIDAYTDVKADYYSVDLQAEIDAITSCVRGRQQRRLSLCFASAQQPYKDAFDRLFPNPGEVRCRLLHSFQM